MTPQTLHTPGRHVRGNIYIKLPRRRDFHFKPPLSSHRLPASAHLRWCRSPGRPSLGPCHPFTGPHSAPVSAPAFHFPSLLFFHYTIHAVLPPILLNTSFLSSCLHCCAFSLSLCREKKKKNLKRVALHSLRPSPLLTFSLELSLLSLPLPPAIIPSCTV